MYRMSNEHCENLAGICKGGNLTELNNEIERHSLSGEELTCDGNEPIYSAAKYSNLNIVNRLLQFQAIRTSFFDHLEFDYVLHELDPSISVALLKHFPNEEILSHIDNAYSRNEAGLGSFLTHAFENEEFDLAERLFAFTPIREEILSSADLFDVICDYRKNIGQYFLDSMSDNENTNYQDKRDALERLLSLRSRTQMSP